MAAIVKNSRSDRSPARYFLNKTGHAFDAIILDAFLGDASPSPFMTQEAFAAIRSRLNPYPHAMVSDGCFPDDGSFLASPNFPYGFFQQKLQSFRGRRMTGVGSTKTNHY